MIGVVGGIGSGKSAVSGFLEALGAFVIDADKVGHALLDQPPVLEPLVERFGRVILNPNSNSDESSEGPASVDRKALGSIVFSDPKALKALELILHPRMRQTFSKAIARTIRRGEAKAVVLDAAILHEAGWASLCDRVLFVEAPAEVRLERLRESRGWSEETLNRREASQWPLDRKRNEAEWVIQNATDLEALKSAVGGIWTKVLASAPIRHRGPVRPKLSKSDSESKSEEARESGAPPGGFNRPSPERKPARPKRRPK